jgi:choline dehydrogenase
LADLIERELSPGVAVSDYRALVSAIETSLDTYHHGASTVPMAGEANIGGVVDAAGRVNEVEGLRIIDASIFPEIPSTPTNLTTIMVVERLASIWQGSHR